MVEAYVDDNFSNLTPLGRIIANKEVHYSTKSSKQLPDFGTLIDEDKSAFEVNLYNFHLNLLLGSHMSFLTGSQYMK